MRPELTYANAAAAILKHRGDVRLGYITASLEPYSAQEKPDISFRPNKGPNAGRVFFIELRVFEGAKFPDHLPKALQEHRSFAIDGAECEFAGFAFATNAKLDAVAIQRLATGGIRYLGPVDSGEVLADRIVQWSSEPN